MRGMIIKKVKKYRMGALENCFLWEKRSGFDGMIRRMV